RFLVQRAWRAAAVVLFHGGKGDHLSECPPQRAKVEGDILGRGQAPSPRQPVRLYYGRLTVAPSPVAGMLKVPALLFGAYEYGCQPEGGFGMQARNGPAVWF